MVHAVSLSKPPSETTDLERRVLAHERVLQALIAFMSRTEPCLVDHLRERFVDPMNTARREHDYRDSDDYAEEFIRAVMVLGEARVPIRRTRAMAVKQPQSTRDKGSQGLSHERSARWDRIQVRERNGIWEVRVDGIFRGDYHQKEHALAAATSLKLSLQ